MSDIHEPAAPPTPPPKRKALKGIRERYPGTFGIVLELGYETDASGTRRRKQKFITFKATPGLSLAEQRKEAEDKRTDLLSALNHDRLIEKSKVTLLEWLRTWLATSIAPPMKRPATHRAYQAIVEHHIAKDPIARLPLQHVKKRHLRRYLAGIGPGSVALHAAVLHGAFEIALEDGLRETNPADRLKCRRPPTAPSAIRAHCWSEVEARRVTAAAQLASSQVAAYVCLALDSGARKAELNGLQWSDVDFDAGRLTIERQLDKTRAATVAEMFGPTKNKKARTFDLGAETLTALRTHRRQQLELRLKNGAHYVDLGLVFAKEEIDLQTADAALGQPIQTLSEDRFQAVIEAAGVKRIKFHGCRHTCATLLLNAHVPPHVVAARLGHDVMVLMKTYAHALPNQSRDAAARLSDLLYGR